MLNALQWFAQMFKSKGGLEKSLTGEFQVRFLEVSSARLRELNIFSIYYFQEPVVPCSGQVKNQVWRGRWVYHRVKGSADLRLWCRKCSQMYFLKKNYREKKKNQQLTVFAAVTPSAIGSTSTRDCLPTFSEEEDWIKIGKLLKLNGTMPLKIRYTFVCSKRIQHWLHAFVQILFLQKIFKTFSFQPLPPGSCQDILEQPEQPHSPLENLSRPQPLMIIQIGIEMMIKIEIGIEIEIQIEIQIGIEMMIWWSHAHPVLFVHHNTPDICHSHHNHWLCEKFAKRFPIGTRKNCFI